MNQIAFHPLSRSSIAAAGTDGTLYLWDTNQSSSVESIPKAHSGPISGIGWCPTTKGMIATVGHDRALKIWNLNNRQLIKSFKCSIELFTMRASLTVTKCA